MLQLISLLILAASASELTAEANTLSRAGKAHEARLKLEQAFLMAPGELPVLTALARFREDDGDIPGALDALDSFLTLESRGAEADDAQKHIARLKLRTQPIPAPAREAFNRAGALLRLNRTEEGEKALLEAEAQAPNWLEVLSWLASYYETVDRPADAVPRLRRLMAIATDAELAKLQTRTAEAQIRADDQARAQKARREAEAADRILAQQEAVANAARNAAEQKTREEARQRALVAAEIQARENAAEAERLRQAFELETRRNAERTRTTTRRVGFGLTAAGAATFVGFAVFEGLALSAEGQVKNGGLATDKDIVAAVQTNNSMSTGALITAIAGGTLIVTGVLTAVLNLEAPPAVSVGVMPGGAAVSFGGTFP